jgi:L-alanine-DL-glutamate epimerase-like enolase superfamily enzyme
MKISDIQTAVIEANYDWTIVKVITDEDIIGYGECFFAPGLTKVIHELKPLLIGEDGRDIDRLCLLMREAGATSGSGTGGIILARYRRHRDRFVGRLRQVVGCPAL